MSRRVGLDVFQTVARREAEAKRVVEPAGFAALSSAVGRAFFLHRAEIWPAVAIHVDLSLSFRLYETGIAMWSKQQNQVHEHRTAAE